MATTRDRRVAKELKDIELDKDNSGVYACPADGSSLVHLKGSFPAPPDTPYAGGMYMIDIQIPQQYPFKSPIMKFDTRIWHPNVSSQTGAICLDTLGSGWSPVGTIKTALLSLRMLLEAPNPRDPQDAQVAKMMLEDPEYFNVMAHDWAVRYAGAQRRLPPPAEFTRKAVEPSKPEEEDIQRYQGYSKDLINQFVNMGFELDAVVAAFNHVGIERRGGMNYNLEEAAIGDITAYLFGEQ